jgi:serine/threonine protein kinase
VTEYHPHGTLAQSLSLLRGNALGALEAFKVLVEGVAEIHNQGAIHRDIKPENIFVTPRGLVLGDFGIVFFEMGSGARLTSTYERVGSHFWMAPWAYENARLSLSQVQPALDVYPLGKVLWSMISGKNGFPFWEYDRDANNLEKMFPDDPNMPLVNTFLAKCIVREERDCLFSTVAMMHKELDELIYKVKERRGPRPDGAKTWPCRVCGKGAYHPAATPAGAPVDMRGQPLMLAQITGVGITDRVPFSIFVCDHCGHAELFKAYS